MRTSARIFLLAGLVLSFAASTYAQETLWWELSTEFIMLDQQGRYSEAAKVAEETLTVAEKTFGPEHPYMATSLNNLASVYHSQGKYAEAEPLYKRALKIREKAFGKDHPFVAAVCENMADLYRQIGKGSKAKKFEERAKKIRSKP